MTNKRIYQLRYGKLAEYVINYKKQHNGNLPWSRAYFNILSRCRNRTDKKFKFYGGRGVVCRITPSELKELFYRDEAHLMESPSVDRINPIGDYTKENVRWIEFKINRRERGLNHPLFAAQSKIFEKNINEQLDLAKWPTRIRRNFFRRLIKKLENIE